MIAVCIGGGIVLKAARLIPGDAHKGINIWILYMALPAMSFTYIPKIQWSVQMLFPAISSLIVWTGSWLFMELYCTCKKYGQRSRSTLELTSGYSNTSFIGFPLIAAYFGEQYLSIAIICDQMGFILLSTAGIVSAAKADRKGRRKADTAKVLKKLITFPPFIGCISALLMGRFFDLSFAEPFFRKLSSTVGPLALFSVGLQLKFKGWKQFMSQLSAAMLYKLLIAPALVLVAALIVGIRSDIARISIFEAAMPALISASIVIEQFNLNIRLANQIVGFGILLGFITTAFWDVLLHWLI